jgi:transposase-like protein
MFDKRNAIIGGEGRIVEIDESLFIKVKHNRGRDMRREKVWVFGLYERATEDQPKRVLFFQVEARDAVTLLNIIYNHVRPGTTIYSDCWAAYNRIIALDRNYHHQMVNHSLTFVAPDGTHTNSIESTWKAAKRQFKEMNGVSRLYLQAYLDEYCWRLTNGNRDGWLVFTSVVQAIKDYFELFRDGNNNLDQSILEDNNIINQSVDDSLDFGDYANERSELPLGEINDLTIPLNRTALPLQQVRTLLTQSQQPQQQQSQQPQQQQPRPQFHESMTSLTSDESVTNHASLVNNQSTPIRSCSPSRPCSPPSKRSRPNESNHRMNITYDVDSPSTTTPTTVLPAITTASRIPIPLTDIEKETLISFYRPKLDRFIEGDDEQFICTSDLSKEQREVVHNLAEELGLHHESKGNWRRKTLYIYKTQLTLPASRRSQAISTALQNQARSHQAASQHANQNVMDVVEAALADVMPDAVPAQTRKRGRPPKQISSTQATTVGLTRTTTTTSSSSQPTSSTNTRYNFRNRKN